ncbi:MAG: peptide ABC transporter substrate-binding protein [Lachnospiraceae bacterium]|jgi:peptide/nickel transport system substrate-binding protein|nr:peptide ABC transporter substrate-binding protein [uncultured Acetatifactor sp.]MCI9570793.1 peptide ABC transporter substrate-binding protein [Lachnospiraceae bacterium]
MKKSKRLICLMMAAAMTAGLLSGCGGGGSASTTAAPATEATTQATEAEAATTAGTATEAAGQAAAGSADYSNDVITYGMTQAWDTINPYGSSSGSMYQNLVCDKLYDRLAFIEEAGTGVSPRGAKSWESADNGMAAVFHLDENAKWHDGQPVTANDWVYTAQLITNPKFDYGLRSEFNTWAGTDETGLEESEKSVKVEAVDDYTLKITFKNVTPVEDWLILHNKYYYVLPEHLLGDIAPENIKTDEFWKAPVGSGPCTFISELSGSELQFGSFEGYHLGTPKFGKLVLKVIAPTNTITSIAAGEMDGFFQAPSVDDAMAAKDMGLNVEQSSAPTTVAVFLINNQNVADKRVRQAMSYAIDKELLIDQSLQGMGVPSTTCIIPGSEYDCGLQWSRDVEKAKELLAEAGWDSSRKLSMVVTSARESMAAVIQQNLAEAGITIEVQTVELATMFAGLQDGTYDLGICGSTAMGYPLWMSGYYDNKNATYCQISDTKYAEIQDAIAAEIDDTKRRELINEYQELLYDEMPLVMLYHGYSFNVKSDRFQGYNGFEGGANNQAVWKWSVSQ